MSALKRGDSGEEVRKLQRILCQDWDYAVDVDGVFGPQTERAIKQFQSSHHDEHGGALVVDGRVGPLTWWALTHRAAPRPQTTPPAATGGSRCGLKALEVARQEMAAGAGEEGGNNKGKWVRKYLQPTGLPEGSPWCASFVSWCVMQACGGDKNRMPFRYCPGARNLFAACKAKGMEVQEPKPGDLIVWWRESLHSGKGHIGFVEAVKDGFVYTIEGNKTPQVARFRYVQGRIDQLIGYIRLPDSGC